MKAGAGTVNMGFLSWSPGVSAISGKTFTDSIEGADQHPQEPSFFSDNHVFIKASVGDICMAAKRNSFSLVGRSVYIRKLLLLQTVAFGGTLPLVSHQIAQGNSHSPLVV